LYPGALVEGDPALITTGQLKPIPMVPGAGTLTLTGAHLTPSSGGTVIQHVSPADSAHVATAVQTLQDQTFNPQSVDAVASDFQIVTSSKQAELDSKASFGFGPVGASGFFDTADDTTQSHVLFTLREVYYDIAYNPDPDSAGLSDLDAFFAPGTTADQAQTCGCMSTSNPPMFVKKVTYGSEFLFMASSTADSSDLKAGLQAAVSAGFSASGSVSTEQKALLDQTNIKVLAVGGDTRNLATVISGSLGNDGKNVLSALKAYAQASIADRLHPRLCRQRCRRGVRTAAERRGTAARQRRDSDDAAHGHDHRPRQGRRRSVDGVADRTRELRRAAGPECVHAVDQRRLVHVHRHAAGLRQQLHGRVHGAAAARNTRV
jgi:hypothetical protein